MKNYEAKITRIRDGEVEQFMFQAIDDDQARAVIQALYGAYWIWKINYIQEVFKPRDKRIKISIFVPTETFQLN